MDSTNKIEYHIRKLGTRSVTLFPSRAQVTREIKDVVLKPGTNDITIVGLSPTVDEDSVRVDVNGAFMISDVSVESLPNKDIWEEVYPDELDDDQSDAEEDDDGDFFQWKDGPELQEAKKLLADLQDDLNLATETVVCAESRLSIIETFGKSFDRSEHSQAFSAEKLELYRNERAKAYRDFLSGTKENRQIQEEVDRQRQKVDRLQILDTKAAREAQRAWEKARKPKVDTLVLRKKQRDERRKEKVRIRDERKSFWPKACYSVRVTIEASPWTPASSRRASMATEVDVSKHSDVADYDGDAPLVCDLLLSYVTTSAHWSPTYELKLSTTSAKGVLSFEAELHNTTSETWSNCKVSLSTSQATFSGLDDAIPELTPWYMSLAARPPPHGIDYLQKHICRTTEERESTKRFHERLTQPNSQKPRSEMFGVPEQEPEGHLLYQDQKKKKKQVVEEEQEECDLAGAEDVLFSMPYRPLAALDTVECLRATPGAATEHASCKPMVGAARSRVLSQARQQVNMLETLGGGGSGYEPDIDNEPDYAVEETGLTTSFEIPGLKTLAPKSTPSKSRVAHITFTNVEYSHVAVPKCKPVAFLRAKIKNTSKMTLFKGRGGLTLDGSFMGKTTIPRCSAGEAFTVSLGVDPAVKITYPKPLVRRAAAGVFRGDSTVVYYTRSVTLNNTRLSSGRPVSVAVLDQVPVSQDDRLRVGVITPLSLAPGGGSVSTGVPALEAKDNKEWGKAVASLKKDGEVSWDVTLNAGKAVKLNLEYTVTFPSATHPY